MINNTPRVRFAPSPTGYLHVGGLRTALYNYLFAKSLNGEFILRIEDTDRNRFVPGAVENLISTLNWAELDYSEGPDKGGPFGPYLQSERLDIYKEYSQILLKNKKAYYCFCTPDRLTSLREEQQKKNLQSKYDKHCLHLSDEEVNRNLSDCMPFVVRMNVEPEKTIRFTDHIRGEIEFSSDVVDDQVLIKSDNYPTYHLANVVDDHLMKITHVIRGEEWLSSTPKHVLLYDAFGWEIPVFAHLPLLLNADRSKLSKRQGDVAVEDYKNKGFLKEALVNFVALLGWTAGDDKEYYTMEELVSKFSLDRVNKSGAVFNLEKLTWLNEEHLRKKTDSQLLFLLREELINSRFQSDNFADEYLLRVISVMKERVSFIKEFLEKGFYFFEDPLSYEESAVKKRWNARSADILRKYSLNISSIPSPQKEDYETALHNTAIQMNTGNGDVIHPLRLAVSGVGGGPGIFDILYIIGKEKTIFRINRIIEKLN
jgi:glutamyl-tRNA synthetase